MSCLFYDSGYLTAIFWSWSMVDERRWLVVGSDGRHVTLGRASDPTPNELARAEEALRGQGLAGWLVVSSGDYWGSRPLELLMVRPLTELPGATWEAAKEAFLATRKAAPTR
jgi:hypothetical protein